MKKSKKIIKSKKPSFSKKGLGFWTLIILAIFAASLLFAGYKYFSQPPVIAGVMDDYKQNLSQKAAGVVSTNKSEKEYNQKAGNSNEQVQANAAATLASIAKTDTQDETIQALAANAALNVAANANITQQMKDAAAANAALVDQIVADAQKYVADKANSTAAMGGSCPGGSSNIGGGQWAQTGGGIEGTDTRYCVQCGGVRGGKPGQDGVWGDQTEICGQGNAKTYITRPDEVLDCKNNINKSPNCTEGRVQGSCWKNGTWYADTTSAGGSTDKCFDGNWKSKDDYDAAMKKDRCGELGYNATTGYCNEKDSGLGNLNTPPKNTNLPVSGTGSNGLTDLAKKKIEACKAREKSTNNGSTHTWITCDADGRENLRFCSTGFRANGDSFCDLSPVNLGAGNTSTLPKIVDGAPKSLSEGTATYDAGDCKNGGVDLSGKYGGTAANGGKVVYECKNSAGGLGTITSNTNLPGTNNSTNNTITKANTTSTERDALIEAYNALIKNGIEVKKISVDNCSTSTSCFDYKNYIDLNDLRNKIDENPKLINAQNKYEEIIKADKNAFSGFGYNVYQTKYSCDSKNLDCIKVSNGLSGVVGYSYISIDQLDEKAAELKLDIPKVSIPASTFEAPTSNTQSPVVSDKNKVTFQNGKVGVQASSPAECKYGNLATKDPKSGNWVCPTDEEGKNSTVPVVQALPNNPVSNATGTGAVAGCVAGGTAGAVWGAIGGFGVLSVPVAIVGGVVGCGVGALGGGVIGLGVGVANTPTTPAVQYSQSDLVNVVKNADPLTLDKDSLTDDSSKCKNQGYEISQDFGGSATLGYHVYKCNQLSYVMDMVSYSLA